MESKTRGHCCATVHIVGERKCSLEERWLEGDTIKVYKLTGNTGKVNMEFKKSQEELGSTSEITM